MGMRDRGRDVKNWDHLAFLLWVHACLGVVCTVHTLCLSKQDLKVLQCRKLMYVELRRLPPDNAPFSSGPDIWGSQMTLVFHVSFLQADQK